MIRKRIAKEPEFYSSEEIAKPSDKSIYTQMKKSGIDWEALAKPLEKAFNNSYGRPTDPIVYLKIFLIAYIENITFDTNLAVRIADSIAIRSFLGYTLLESPPDHSSISSVRSRIASLCNIEEVLINTVMCCAKAGLIGGETTAVDTSLIPANASLRSLEQIDTGKSISEYLKEVAEKNKNTEKGVENSGNKKEKVKVSNEEFKSKTDPDAKIFTSAEHKRDMYFKIVHVTDSKKNIILSAGASRADTGETYASERVIAQAKKNIDKCKKYIVKEAKYGKIDSSEEENTENKVEMKTLLVADTGYDSADFHAYVESLGLTPLTFYTKDTHTKEEGYKKESFIYNKADNSYICPEGKVLRYYYSSEGRMRYISKESECALCKSREKCLDKNGKQRWMSRRLTEESRERNIVRCHTDEGREALKSRKYIVEPQFGHMKTYGGMRMINCRGLSRANVKIVMAAVAHNILKLVRALITAQNLSSAAKIGLRFVKNLFYSILGRFFLIFGSVYRYSQVRFYTYHLTD